MDISEKHWPLKVNENYTKAVKANQKQSLKNSNILNRLHDTSSDRALDGLELFAALSHTVEAYITRMSDKNPVSPARIQKLYEGVASKMYLG